MLALSPGAVSTLIGSIYDCALAPARWETTLAEIARLVECERAILSLNDLRLGRSLLNESAGWEPHWLDEREKHLSECHTHFSKWFAEPRSEDQPFVASRELSASYMDSSPFMQECLGPMGIVDVVHYFLVRTPTHFSELVLTRQQTQGAFSERQLEIGHLLLPHVRRAVTISNAIGSRNIERERFAEALDALRCGVILATELGAILHVNATASRMLHKGGLLEIRRGMLQAKSASAQRELQQALARCARDESQLGRAGAAVRLSGDGHAASIAHVLPLTGSEMRASVHPAAVAAVFVSADPQQELEAFATLFQLTPTEKRVVGGLLAGHTLLEVANRLCIARTTAKAHLDNVFEKTGVSRQVDLISLALRSGHVL